MEICGDFGIIWNSLFGVKGVRAAAGSWLLRVRPAEWSNSQSHRLATEPGAEGGVTSGPPLPASAEGISLPTDNGEQLVDPTPTHVYQNASKASSR